MQQGVDLGDPGVDADHFSRPLGEQVVTEPASSIHLDEQTAQIAEEIFPGVQQCAALTAEQACVWGPGDDTLVQSASAEERGHSVECNERVGGHSDLRAS